MVSVCVLVEIGPEKEEKNRNRKFHTFNQRHYVCMCVRTKKTTAVSVWPSDTHGDYIFFFCIITLTRNRLSSVDDNSTRCPCYSTIFVFIWIWMVMQRLVMLFCVIHYDCYYYYFRTLFPLHSPMICYFFRCRCHCWENWANYWFSPFLHCCFRGPF